MRGLLGEPRRPRPRTVGLLQLVRKNRRRRRREDPARAGIDDLHEVRGADWLARRFAPEVVEPVRLHVPAKRYLCAVDPTYFGQLSEDSVRSLALQGGPMAADEVADFERLPFHAEAVRLRRLDEAAKDPAAETPALDHFMPYVAAVLGERR